MRMGDDTPGLGFAYEDLKAENNRLRAELAALVELSGTWGGRALAAEAAIERVRELCAEIGTKPYWNKADSVAAILAALVGAE